METKMETKLTATQQTMVLALARERQEFNERMDKSMTELAQMLSNSYGFSGPNLFEQRGPDIFLVQPKPFEAAAQDEEPLGEQLKDSMQ